MWQQSLVADHHSIGWRWGHCQGPPWGSMCLLRHIREASDLKLLLRWGQLTFKDTGIRLSILLFICAVLSTETSVREFRSTKTKIQFLEWWEFVWVMGWQSHLDDYFNTAGVLLNYWFCTSVHRGFYNSLIIVTLMKYNKQAQLQFPFHTALIWFCITSKSSFVCKFYQQTINLYCI